MLRLLFGLCSGVALLALACDDEFVETVPKDICYSEMRWIGGKRGSPEMYPGDDCVGCHQNNDGPQLVLGGTIYPYSPTTDRRFSNAQAEHCFGAEGIEVIVEDANGQVFELVTNRAGNFYVEGNPDDFAKPFSVVLGEYEPGVRTLMAATFPSYGGCARCHSPSVAPLEPGAPYPIASEDPEARIPQDRIGLFNYHINGQDAPTVDEELSEIIGSSSQ